jgi:hypothetical protein
MLGGEMWATLRGQPRRRLRLEPVIIAPVLGFEPEPGPLSTAQLCSRR